jgi:hypothetical protein
VPPAPILRAPRVPVQNSFTYNAHQCDFCAAQIVHTVGEAIVVPKLKFFSITIKIFLTASFTMFSRKIGYNVAAYVTDNAANGPDWTFRPQHTIDVYKSCGLVVHVCKGRKEQTLDILVSICHRFEISMDLSSIAAPKQKAPPQSV